MRILFVYNSLTSFIKTDLDILASVHDVDDLDLSARGRFVALPGKLARADLVFAWFASLHSIGPVVGARLLARPSIVVVGGYDTANMPEIGYGYIGHPWKKYVVKTTCRMANVLIANSRAAESEVRKNVGQATPIHVVHHGFVRPSQPIRLEREAVVLSVGNVSRESLRRKGHELFVRTAALVPEVQFVLAGRILDDAGALLERIATPNVTMAGLLPDGQLRELMERASIYVQVSEHEGFGCALAEAMAAGALPVVSRRGALPEVVGECGIVVEQLSPEAVAGAVRKAMKIPSDAHIAAARRIATTFPLEQRRRQLLDLIPQVAGRATMVGGEAVRSERQR